MRGHSSADVKVGMSDRVLSGTGWTLAAGATVAVAVHVVVWVPRLGDATAVERIIPINAVVALVYPLTGALLVARVPRHPLGWLLLCASGSAVAVAAGTFAEVMGTEHGAAAGPLAVFCAWLASWTWVAGFFLIPAIFLRFPSGSLPVGPTRRPAQVATWGPLVVAVACAVSPGAFPYYPWFRNPVGLPIRWFPELTWALIAGFAVTAFPVAGLIVVRCWRQATGFRRKQFAALAVAACCHIIATASSLATSTGLDHLTQCLAALTIPLAVAVAVLHDGSVDIKTVYRRAFTLAVSATVVLVAVSLTLAGLGLVVEDAIPVLVIAAFLAVATYPASRSLIRSIDRLLYGHRDQPAILVAQIEDSWYASPDLASVLSSTVQVLAAGLRLPYVAIELDSDRQTARRADTGVVKGALWAFPLVVPDGVVGTLTVSGRTTHDRLSRREQLVLAVLARQTAITVQAVMMSTDLRHAQRRLVESRDDERRRIQRNLHDGVQSHLSGITMAIAAARIETARTPARASTLLAQIEHQAIAVSHELADVVDGLRPRVLDQLGLVGGVAARVDAIADAQVCIVVDTDFDDAVVLPKHIEAAAYLVIAEALENVTRHSKATLCTVTIAVDTDLRLTVNDNGVGFDPDATPGVGLQSMSGRAVESGGQFSISGGPNGGTLVVATFPIT